MAQSSEVIRWVKDLFLRVYEEEVSGAFVKLCGALPEKVDQ
jgi:hypothetical protein